MHIDIADSSMDTLTNTMCNTGTNTEAPAWESHVAILTRETRLRCSSRARPWCSLKTQIQPQAVSERDIAYIRQHTQRIDTCRHTEKSGYTERSGGRTGERLSTRTGETVVSHMIQRTESPCTTAFLRRRFSVHIEYFPAEDLSGPYLLAAAR